MSSEKIETTAEGVGSFGSSSPSGTDWATAGSYTVMRRLLRQVRDWTMLEVRAITTGTLGHLCAVATVGLSIAAFANAAQNAGTAIVVTLMILAALCAVARGYFAYREQLHNHNMAFSVLRDIRSRVFAKMRRLAPAKLQEKGKGDLVTVLTEDIELLEIFYAHTLSPFAIAVICTLVVDGYIASLNWGLGLLALLGHLVIAALVPALTARSARRASSVERTEQAALHSTLLEYVEAKRDIVRFNAQQHSLGIIENEESRLADARRKRENSSTLNSTIDELLILGLSTLMAGCAAALAFSGTLSAAGALVAFGVYASSFAPVLAVARLGTGLQPTLASARRVFSLMDETPAVTENADGTRLDGFTGLTARELDFAYNASEPVLRNANLDIAAGDFLGVEGRNGAGKTTLLNLLMRFRDRTAGSLEINGTDIARVNTASLRATETLALQDTFIFDGTLRENLLVAKPSATDEEVANAIEQSEISDVIAELPDGLEHRFTAGKEELSDGERQRIGIARALLSDASLLLFDEPTSNMDALLEGRIMHALVKHQQNRTMVLVSHRQAALAYTRRRVELKEGTLIERQPDADEQSDSGRRPNADRQSDSNR